MALSSSPRTAGGQKISNSPRAKKLKRARGSQTPGKRPARALPAGKTRGARPVAGARVSYTGKKSLWAKMGLKRGDIIRSINGQKVSSKKQARALALSLMKRKKSFSLIVSRGKIDLLISYKTKKGAAGFRLVRRKKIKSAERSGNKARAFSKKTALAKKAPAREPASSAKAKIGKARKSPAGQKEGPVKKSLVPDKYRPHLQRAYVLALNSFVYQKPDFDALKLYTLPVGKKILISKKVFRPAHNFGSFYKIFLFKEKKIVGYISTAETAPEFLKQGGEYIANPAYKLAKKQLAKDKVLDIDLLGKTQKKAFSKPKKTPSRGGKRYAGLSFGFSSAALSAARPEDLLSQTFVGLRLSGYALLISYLNMDLSLTSSLDRKFFIFDILTVFPALKSPHIYLSAMAGAKLSADTKIKDPVDYGPVGALSAAFPLSAFLLRIEAKTEYGLRARAFRHSLIGSLQIPF